MVPESRIGLIVSNKVKKERHRSIWRATLAYFFDSLFSAWRSSEVTDTPAIHVLIKTVSRADPLSSPSISYKCSKSLELEIIENIKNCLVFLASIGVNLDGITAKDVREGNLKAILGLFFSLSRHKQKQKQQHQLTAEKEKLQRLHQEQKSQADQQQEEMPQPRLPSPYKHGGAPTTNIPLPATLTRRGGLEKTRQQSAVPNGGLQHPNSMGITQNRSQDFVFGATGGARCLFVEVR
ncbi:hypothetical protein RUM43_013916 [Polyplax serrata]|uniref:Calponin-homology (CH) domain-containing protein n=1 Tax=Polyplax serrata TaxID=468196 RepID=A0AAN8P0A7_POLSC